MHDAAPTTARKTGIRPITVILGIAMTIACVVALVLALTHDGGTTTTGSSNGSHHVWEYTVPFGAGAKLDAGVDLEFFPRTLDVKVGDELVIHNLDNRSQQVGPYLIDRGETLQQTFAEKGTLEGVCTIHPSGKVTIHIT